MRAVLLDLLMATMDSISAWTSAAGDRELGLRWRDAVTERMIAAGRYVPYEQLVAGSAAELRLPEDAAEQLRRAWMEMHPWPDAAAIEALRVPYAFVTNCSTELATATVARSGLRPVFTLSAEEAGWYKPRPEIYRLAVHRLGADAPEIVFVAGSPYDARGADGAGLRTVLVARRPVEAGLPEGIRVVASLDEALAQP